MARPRVVPVSLGSAGGPRIGLARISEDGTTADIRLYDGVVVPGLTDGVLTGLSIVEPEVKSAS